MARNDLHLGIGGRVSRLRRPLDRSDPTSSLQVWIETLEGRCTPAAGGLDLTFGGGGIVTAAVAEEVEALLPTYGHATALQSDGKIVTVGAVSPSSLAPSAGIAPDSDFVVARFNPDGSADASFGIAGFARTDFGGDDAAFSVAIDTMERIVVVGATSAGANGFDFAVARYLSNGVLDPSFAIGGKIKTDFGPADLAVGVVIQQDGQVLVAGSAGSTPVSVPQNLMPQLAFAGDFAVARYTDTGALDATFGSAGTVTQDLGSTDGAVGLALLPNGEFVVAGNTVGNDTGYDFALSKFTSTGAPDTSFGTHGVVKIDFGFDDLAMALTVATDGSGKLIVVGNTNDYIGFPRDVALARLDRIGALDGSFGSGGKVISDILANDGAASIALDDIGRIVVGGSASLVPYGEIVNILLRYRSNGELDPTFGDAGVVLTDVAPGYFDSIDSIAIQPDGNIVAAGFAPIEGYKMVLQRFLGFENQAIIWDGGGDETSWDDPENWNTDTVPTPSDDVVIKLPGASVTYSDGSSNIRSVHCTQRFTVTDGELSLSEDSQIADLMLSGGTISGAGALTITRSMLWSGGSMAGEATTRFNFGSALGLTGSSKFLDGRTLDLSGGMYWIGEGELGLRNNAQIRNRFELNIGANGRIFCDDGSSASFTNFGDVNMDVPNGTFTFDCVAFHCVQFRPVYGYNGTLRLLGGGVNNGDFNFSQPSAIWFGGTNLTVFTGENRFYADNLVFAGPVVIQPNSNFLVIESTIIQTNASVVVMLPHSIGSFGQLTVDGTLIWGSVNTPLLTGLVFNDRGNDGVFSCGDTGIAGVDVALVNSGNVTVATATTDNAGRYFFGSNFGAGTYRIVRGLPAGYLDGKETAGSLGGTVDNGQDADGIGGIAVAAGVVGFDYNFAVILPSRIQGLVWEDFNNDGEVNFGEKAIAGSTIHLLGSDDRGNAVDHLMSTDGQGFFEFVNLRPGNYSIVETQAAGYADGMESMGTVNGLINGSATVNDRFDNVFLGNPGTDGVNYNFGERPAAGGGVQAGQAATIGFWQNKNGQNLIKALNGGAHATQLANWLAATFVNMYGVQAGSNNLTGKSNAEVAAVYISLFKRNGQTSPGGPPKLDAQVLATALAVYVTNGTLAGSTASVYGFNVTASGLGSATFNVGANGAAFGVGNNTVLTVLDILFAVNARTTNGLLFDADGSGTINNAEKSLRSLANEVFASINEQGGV